MFPEIINTDPLRDAVDDGLNWVVRYWGDGLEAAASPLLWLLIYIERGLLAIPWFILIAFLMGLAWLATSSWKLPALVGVSLVFLGDRKSVV